MTKAAVGKVYAEISVVIGWSTMPIHQLLRMGRGAVIELNTTVNDPAYLYVNDQLVARGEVMVIDDHVGITITDAVGAEIEGSDPRNEQ